jgi:hypothetical protein
MCNKSKQLFLLFSVVNITLWLPKSATSFYLNMTEYPRRPDLNSALMVQLQSLASCWWNRDQQFSLPELEKLSLNLSLNNGSYEGNGKSSSLCVLSLASICNWPVRAGYRICPNPPSPSCLILTNCPYSPPSHTCDVLAITGTPYMAILWLRAMSHCPKSARERTVAPSWAPNLP